MHEYLKMRAIGDLLLRTTTLMMLLIPIIIYGTQPPQIVLLDALPHVSGEEQPELAGRNLHVIPNPSTILPQIMKNRQVHVSLHLDAQHSYDLVLERTELLGSNFIYKEIGRSGEVIHPTPDVVAFSGVLQDQENSRVRLTLSEDYLSGMVDDGSGDPVFLESVGMQDNGDLFISHHGRLDWEQIPIRVHQDHGPSPYSNEYTTTSTSLPLTMDSTIHTAEIALVADFETFEKAGSTSRLAAELISILNMTDQYYEELGITYKLVELVIFTDPNAGNWPDTDDAGTYLKAFDRWVDRGGVSNWHDIATFWTGKVFGYSYAWLGTVGQYGRHHVVEFWGMGDSRWLANFQAHESGHNWGASHVAHDPLYIMSPSIYDGPLLWNETTKQNFETYKQNAITQLTPGIEAGIPVISFSQPVVLSNNRITGGVNPGEEVTLRVSVKNVGKDRSGPGELELVLLDTTDEWVDSISASVVIPSLNIEDSVLAEHTIKISPGAPTSAWLKLGYELTADSMSATQPFDIGIGLKAVYDLQLGTLEVSGNADGKFHPGERVALTLDVENIGEIRGDDLNMEVEFDPISLPFVSNIRYPGIIQSIDDDDKKRILISMDLNDDFPSGHQMDVSIRLTDAQTELVYPRSFVVGLPEGYAYWEDFEYDQIGSTFSGWSVQSPIPTQKISSENDLDVYDPVNGEWISTPHEGERSLALGSHWVGSIRMISPKISLKGLRRPVLDFYEQRAWDHTQSAGVPSHTVHVQYALDLDGPWYPLETLSANEAEIGDWRAIEDIDLEAVVNQDVHFAFYSSQAHLFWRLDKITIRDDALADPEIPQNHRVYSYPNPFNATATILYDLDSRSDVRVELFNLRGQLLEVLVEGSKPAGTHAVPFQAETFAAGMYLCRLQTNDNYYVTKMLLMK